MRSERPQTDQAIDDNPYVTVGSKTDAHLVNIRKPWYRSMAAIQDSEPGKEQHFAQLPLYRHIAALPGWE